MNNGPKAEQKEHRMNHEFPPDLEQQLQEQMTLGHYDSESDLIRDALQALRTQNEDMAAIQAGLDDLDADRVRPLRDIASDIRQRHGWSH